MRSDKVVELGERDGGYGRAAVGAEVTCEVGLDALVDGAEAFAGSEGDLFDDLDRRDGGDLLDAGEVVGVDFDKERAIESAHIGRTSALLDEATLDEDAAVGEGVEDLETAFGAQKYRDAT